VRRLRGSCRAVFKGVVERGLSTCKSVRDLPSVAVLRGPGPARGRVQWLEAMAIVAMGERRALSVRVRVAMRVDVRRRVVDVLGCPL
jgi:hypothetical protein